VADLVDRAVAFVQALPPVLLYLVIGLGAAIENIIPPVPADTFVLLGGFLAAQGRASPLLVFLATWTANVGSALGVYALARRYGSAFFQTPLGHWLLHPRQIHQIGVFYARWGVPAIFVSRFLPGLRAVVPVFAGLTGVPFRRLAPPLALASALWYGLIVYAGALLGDNWATVVRAFERISGVFLWVALPLLAAVVVWWLRSRRHRHG
jgi:membrane protein DedA with SNARE-associated domain